MIAVIALGNPSTRCRKYIFLVGKKERATYPHKSLPSFSFCLPKDREEKLIVSRVENAIKVSTLPVDLTPEVQREFFEKGWGPYLIKEG
jgi:hypothetical protein